MVDGCARCTSVNPWGAPQNDEIQLTGGEGGSRPWDSPFGEPVPRSRLQASPPAADLGVRRLSDGRASGWEEPQGRRFRVTAPRQAAVSGVPATERCRAKRVGFSSTHSSWEPGHRTKPIRSARAAYWVFSHERAWSTSG
jgi:hypothetical protein